MFKDPPWPLELRVHTKLGMFRGKDDGGDEDVRGKKLIRVGPLLGSGTASVHPSTGLLLLTDVVAR